MCPPSRDVTMTDCVSRLRRSLVCVCRGGYASWCIAPRLAVAPCTLRPCAAIYNTYLVAFFTSVFEGGVGDSACLWGGTQSKSESSLAASRRYSTTPSSSCMQLCLASTCAFFATRRLRYAHAVSRLFPLYATQRALVASNARLLRCSTTASPGWNGSTLVAVPQR